MVLSTVKLHFFFSYSEACDDYKHWALAGRRRQAPEHENKQLANAKYKYAVCFISRNEQTKRADSRANKLMGNNIFRKEVRFPNNCKPSPPCIVERVSGEDNVSCLAIGFTGFMIHPAYLTPLECPVWYGRRHIVHQSALCICGHLKKKFNMQKLQVAHNKNPP